MLVRTLALISCQLVLSQVAEFEVASVKLARMESRDIDPLPWRRGGPGTSDPERMVLKNYSLRELICLAFRTMPAQMAGPAWLITTDPTARPDRFEIEAKLPPNTSEDQLADMIRNLLVDRFELKAQWRMRQSPVYFLGVYRKFVQSAEPRNTGAGGEGDPANAVRLQSKGSDGFPVVPGNHSSIFVKREAKDVVIRFTQTSMAEFAQWLWSQLKRPVFDHSGLSGKYNFYVRRPMAGDADSSLDATPESVGAASLIAAIRSQLGLTLDAHTSPVRILEIEHVKREPSEN
jgi:uncharacterized protein (TIGR03435 family)